MNATQSKYSLLSSIKMAPAFNKLIEKSHEK